VDGPSTHHALSRHCLRLLSSSHGLQENICGLEYPGQPRRQIDSFVIAKCLSPALQYACRYWVHHVEYSLVRIEDDDQVHAFLKKHFLHWLEVLSLIDRLADAISFVNVLQSLVVVSATFPLFPFSPFPVYRSLQLNPVSRQQIHIACLHFLKMLDEFYLLTDILSTLRRSSFIHL